MSKKTLIFEDKITQLILNEVRGISFEVREWAQIIKTVVEEQYDAYWKSYRASQPSYGSFGRSISWPSFSWGRKKTQPKEYITVADVSGMAQWEINRILGKIFDFYGLPYDEILDLEPEDIVKLYNDIEEPADEYDDYYGHGLMYDPQQQTTTTATTVDKPTKIIINGKDHPEAYKNFAVDKWILEDKNPTEYDHRNSGYNEAGEYVVYINCSMSSNMSSYILIHEIKHAYQDWHRISTNHPPIRQSKEALQLYTQDFERYVLAHKGGYNLDSIESIISAYYMSSPFEVTAYLESAYDTIQNKTAYQYNIFDQLYTLGKQMVAFKIEDVEKFTRDKNVQKKWNKIITEYDIPLFRKFKDVNEFLKYTEKLFHKRGRNIMKKVNKLRTMDHGTD